jgi:hypothetical protein
MLLYLGIPHYIIFKKVVTFNKKARNYSLLIFLNNCFDRHYPYVADTGCLERKSSMMDLKNGKEAGFLVPVLLS